jgi:glycosyltransferase involved in cell wall biosynthesis
MYAGAVGLANDIDCLLRVASRLRNQAEIVFTIVGDGKERLRLQREADSLRLNNVRFIAAQSKQQMPKVLAAANACLAILKNLPMLRTTYPNKVFDYMAAGRPTILAIDGAILKLSRTPKVGCSSLRGMTLL